MECDLDADEPARDWRVDADGAPPLALCLVDGLLIEEWDFPADGLPITPVRRPIDDSRGAVLRAEPPWDILGREPEPTVERVLLRREPNDAEPLSDELPPPRLPIEPFVPRPFLFAPAPFCCLLSLELFPKCLWPFPKSPRRKLSRIPL